MCLQGVGRVDEEEEEKKDFLVCVLLVGKES
jgi:hypothetical protein